MIWTSSYTCNFKQIQIQQNEAVRLFGQYNTGIFSIELTFRKLKILNVLIRKIRDFRIDIFMLQRLNGFAPEIFNIFFRFNSFYHGCATRNAEDLVSRSRSIVRSICVARKVSPVVWNRLNLGSGRCAIIKNWLKEHLLVGVGECGAE